ncbi:RNA demethylase ALKBH10B-like isoform X1 [Salvia splendens]|uniref:RNA demethylase ALKBH10B-like isoform X1 n=1 Tax=Salvia splendens TaxID=180675 RepID=UPI001C27477C|nr:RNA demethylase ALKBH10B-like isoform X1 [Salvia splendens]
MAPAAGVVLQGDRAPSKPIVLPQLLSAAVPEVFAKDAIIAWFRGEFAAANAIIDALCTHLQELEAIAGVADYGSVYAAIHHRRLNWVPILQMQKYYPIVDVVAELEKVAEKKRDPVVAVKEECVDGSDNDAGETVAEDGGSTVVDSPESDYTDSGSQELQILCSNHDECEARQAQIKMTKGFVAKEPVKGQMVNVVRGLKLYQDIFTGAELSKLSDFVNELRLAGRDGELSGDTYILYNQHVKGNKRELIQLGVPIFGQIKEDATDKFQKSYIQPIPALIQDVIDHLIQWHLIPENRKPNSCIINFFDEGEYSHPFLKPPHLDQPLSILLLSKSTMAFGRTLFSDSEGNYKGPLTLSLKEGSLLVMRRSSSDTARHAMCSSQNRRVSISFFRVRSLRRAEAESSFESMNIWQQGLTAPYTTQDSYETFDGIPKCGFLQSPVVMLAPLSPMAISPGGTPRGGTGVFLPWSVGLPKPAKHLPPRAQRQRFLPLPSTLDTQS